MPTYSKDNSGNFPIKPFYPPKEMDQITEEIVINFLNKKYKKVELPISTDDLCSLIEEYVDDLDLYASLDNNIEGTNVISNCGKNVKIKINKYLQQDYFKNRLRTTLAHELGHTILHAPLFDRKYTQQSLFEIKKDQEITCNIDDINSSNTFNWAEYQANVFAVSILTPKTFLLKYINEFCAKKNTYSFQEDSENAKELIRLTSDKFQVSKEAIKYRLKNLKILSEEEPQASLF
ncbi:MAG: ImmA/IrrE family metallo-endopeptidase [Alphaproteobacteria bacterium]|nr:ImmA/IrrE family metallo-endopeptidase [Alphaproteobacteria bacterium]